MAVTPNAVRCRRVIIKVSWFDVVREKLRIVGGCERRWRWTDEDGDERLHGRD